MGTDTLVVSRTDAEAATLLDSNVDERDHPYILGTANGSLPALNELLADAMGKGATKEEIQKYAQLRFDFDLEPILNGLPCSISEQWVEQAQLSTYYDAVAKAIRDEKRGADVRVLSLPIPFLLADANVLLALQSYLKEWEKAKKLSFFKARELAKDIGVNLSWCWDKPRTREGYYRIQNGIPISIGTPHLLFFITARTNSYSLLQTAPSLSVPTLICSGWRRRRRTSRMPRSSPKA